MARGQEAKARRKEQRKEAKKIATEMIDGPLEGEEEEEELPLPPSQQQRNSEGAPIEEDSSDDDDDDGSKIELFPPPPRKPKAKKRSLSEQQPQSGSKNKTEKQSKYTNRAMKAAGAAAGGKGIKKMPLIFLAIMLGTTLIPALIYASDFLGGFFAKKNNVLGSIGYRLGVGSTPRKRVLSFYEKHDPDKINEMPKIMSKYYGDYPKLIKKLERKYQDYGYFIEWEQDEAPMTLAIQQVVETRDYVFTQFMTYAPQPVKTAIRNMQFNVGKLYRKFRRVWKKTLWPLVEPIFGVPDGSAAQKRQDAKEFREKKRKNSGGSGGGGGRRRKNTEFRDDIEDEHWNKYYNYIVKGIVMMMNGWYRRWALKQIL